MLKPAIGLAYIVNIALHTHMPLFYPNSLFAYAFNLINGSCPE